MVFIESRSFTARLQELAGAAADDVLRMTLWCATLSEAISCAASAVSAKRGPPTSRVKGKRGGYRYMYLYLQGRNHIHLRFLLDKSEAEDVNAEQRAALRKMGTQ